MYVDSLNRTIQNRCKLFVVSVDLIENFRFYSFPVSSGTALNKSATKP